jgi:hypothetical protein
VKIAISNWTFSELMNEKELTEAFSHLHSVQMTSPRHLEIIKESIDRRHKPRYVYTVHVDINENISCESLNQNNKGLHFKELNEADLAPPIPDTVLDRQIKKKDLYHWFGTSRYVCSIQFMHAWF